MPTIRKVLVANRGEIAVRVVRACRERGLASVAVYSDCDRTSRHVRMADEAWRLGGNAPSESYLRIDAIVDIARRSGADAVHPGYGFLAENAAFAEACVDAGLIFIGPTPAAIRAMGSKTAARDAATAAGVAVVPGTGARRCPRRVSEAEVARAARGVGYPLMLKAVAGGGGKGMRLVTADDELPGALRAARSEAQSSFGDASVYLERRLERPRHIEVQLLGDQHGTVLPFVERECSIQRRHQKVLEESPSPVVTPDQRRALAEAAARVARARGLHQRRHNRVPARRGRPFYFLEMNTRLQVEHPVTEMVTGVDLVEWQLRIAEGEPLTLDAEALIAPRGHAIEARIYAEDPDDQLPALTRARHAPPRRVRSGRARRWRPHGAGGGADLLRSAGVEADRLGRGSHDRPIRRLARALREYEIEGIKTTIPFFRWLLTDEDYLAARVDTTWLDRVLAARAGQPFWASDEPVVDLASIAAAIQACASPAPRGGCCDLLAGGRRMGGGRPP